MYEKICFEVTKRIAWCFQEPSDLYGVYEARREKLTMYSRVER